MFPQSGNISIRIWIIIDIYMLQVILTILKIIGITLLIILGIIVSLVLIILLVPIRYRFWGDKDDNNGLLSLKLNISFLLHIFSVWVIYKDKMDIKIKVFGINIRSLLNKRKNKTSKENEDRAGDIEAKAVEDVKKEETKETADYTIDWNEPEEDRLDNKIDYLTNDIVDVNANDEDTLSSEDIEQNLEVSFREKIDIFLTKIFEFIINIPEKVFDFLDSFEDKIDEGIIRLDKVIAKINYYDKLLNDRRNKRAFEEGIREVKYITRHLIPKRIEGTIGLGFEDPATLGSVLMYIGMFSPILPNKVSYIPYYDEDRIDGNITIRGRFSLIIFIITAFRLYFNKDVRRLYRIIKKNK